MFTINVIITKKIFFFLRSKIFILNHSLKCFFIRFHSQKNTAIVHISNRQEKVEKNYYFFIEFSSSFAISKAQFLFYFLLTFLSSRWYSARENHHKSGCYLFFYYFYFIWNYFLFSLEHFQTQSPPFLLRRNNKKKTWIFLFSHTYFFLLLEAFQLLTKSLQNAAHPELLSIASYSSNDAKNGLRSIRESKSSSLFFLLVNFCTYYGSYDNTNNNTKSVEGTLTRQHQNNTLKEE